MLDGNPAPLKRSTAPPPPIFGPCLLRRNSWIDQDVTWYGGRPRPSRHCVLHWDPLLLKRGTAATFRPCLLWPNGWINISIRPGFSGTIPIFNDVFRKKSQFSRDAHLSRFGLLYRICSDIDKLCYFNVRIGLLILTCWSLNPIG